MTTDCSICCEKYNKSNHLAVLCKGCDSTDVACRTCSQTYILSSSQDPSCMFCKSAWDREFMNNYLTKKFVDKDLKTYSENLFLERQISLLPDTQKDALVAKKIIDLTKKSGEATTELNRIKKRLLDQKEIIRAYNLEINRLQTGTSTSDDTTRENFTVKCCSGDCNGFLNNKYYCNLCETKFCRHCMEVKEEDHECDSDLRATILAIKKDSKPCPGCNEMISKIDGCDSMWCIKCHVQFSWRTGLQITGYNHNPEYFRWMRESGVDIARNPHEQGEMLCGERFTDRTINDIITNVFPTNKYIIIYYNNVYRFYRHVGWTLRRLDNETQEPELRRIRVNYLLGNITKEAWKKTLQQIDKKTKKTKSYNNIWNLIQTVLHSYMEKIITLNNTTGCMQEFVTMAGELDKFRKYINDSFLGACSTFGSTSCPGISENWTEIYNYKKFIADKIRREKVETLRLEQLMQANEAGVDTRYDRHLPRTD